MRIDETYTIPTQSELHAAIQCWEDTPPDIRTDVMTRFNCECAATVDYMAKVALDQITNDPDPAAAHMLLYNLIYKFIRLGWLAKQLSDEERGL